MREAEPIRAARKSISSGTKEKAGNEITPGFLKPENNINILLVFLKDILNIIGSHPSVSLVAYEHHRRQPAGTNASET